MRLLPDVERVGQPYVDEPVYDVLQPSPVAQAISNPQPIQVLTGHERVRLKWMKPDGKGGFVPMKG